MNHIMRTVFGDLQSSIKGLGLDKPYQGVLQGNVVGPITWVASSTLAVEVLKDRNCRVNIISAISKRLATTIGSIFVDDTNLASRNLNGGMSDLDSTIKKIQESIEW